MRRNGIGSRDIAFASEYNFGVGDDPEAFALSLAHATPSGRAQARVHFRPRDEESPAIVDLLPPTEVTIAFVENIGRAGLDRQLAADFDVVDGCGGDLDVTWDIDAGIVDDVQFHAADAPVPRSPLAYLAQRDRAGIDQAHHLGPFAPRLPIRPLRQHRKCLGENADRAARIGIRQRRAGEFADIQMIMMVGIGVEGELEPAQAIGVAQLRENQRHQMIPTFERFVVGIALVPIHKGLKPPPIDRFKQTSKDAIEVSHARLLLSLDNQKVPVCIGMAEHAPRHSESFPGQPCACGGGLGRG